MVTLGELREECGVFGVIGHRDAALLTYYALYALQHRGQESAGIASVRRDWIEARRGMGLVSEVFDDEILGELESDTAIGHVRYSTSGESLLVNAQPIVVRFKHGSLALAHNGNLINAHLLKERLEGEGSIFQTTSDTEVIAHLIARQPWSDLEEAVLAALKEIRGAYGLVIMTKDRLFAARDPHGIRPLVLGRLNGTFVVASETCALETIGAEFVREIEPGELLVIPKEGEVYSLQIDKGEREAFCVFEYIYFARPDSDFRNRNVHLVRKNLGRFLAEDYPVIADVVTGVPDSSISAASGYAEEAKIPYQMGLIKNRYLGRTFIQPTQRLRERGVRLKLNPIKQVVWGKRVVLVDDSIVRGTTAKHIVQLLRLAGAKEVHLRISSPPYRFPCYYGIDTSQASELVAVGRSVEEIREMIGADSLEFLSVKRMVEACGFSYDSFCTACFTGDYPVSLEKRVSLPNDF